MFLFGNLSNISTSMIPVKPSYPYVVGHQLFFAWLPWLPKKRGSTGLFPRVCALVHVQNALGVLKAVACWLVIGLQSHDVTSAREVSVIFMSSEGPTFVGGQERLGIYSVEKGHFEAEVERGVGGLGG